jgi:hypothetical protein
MNRKTKNGRTDVDVTICFFVTDNAAKKARVLVLEKFCLTTSTLASKAGAHPNGAPYCAMGRFGALLANITLTCNDLSRTYSLTYFVAVSVTKKKF